jgi:ABC-type branched-subunit amino acid transport system ATPase component
VKTYIAELFSVLGRVLMSRPDLWMLDEPSLGRAPKLLEEVLGIIRNIYQKGMTILPIDGSCNQLPSNFCWAI